MKNILDNKIGDYMNVGYYRNEIDRLISVIHQKMFEVTNNIRKFDVELYEQEKLDLEEWLLGWLRNNINVLQYQNEIENLISLYQINDRVLYDLNKAKEKISNVFSVIRYLDEAISLLSYKKDETKKLMQQVHNVKMLFVNSIDEKNNFPNDELYRNIKSAIRCLSFFELLLPDENYNFYNYVSKIQNAKDYLYYIFHQKHGINTI